MNSIRMTPEIASAICRDAGNASMRKAGRTSWNEEDSQAATDAGDRIAHLVPGWTEANPLRCSPPK